eukprot:TRINITY_DN20547_c0_g1_i1.p1 TRINITY_DN20547_c0_g1~~TRINITY_DN20547_c0_g1_i1.p1  ORF type:complete len:498 (-),score=118.88 TRINITY_DN20547_c0_g1_i1:73-1566(-)
MMLGMGRADSRFFVCALLVAGALFAVRPEGVAAQPIPTSVSAHYGNASVFFERVVLSDRWYGDYGMSTADLNGDNLLDVVALAWGTGRVAWFENPGTRRTQWLQHDIGVYTGVVDADFYDVDGDGMLDIVLSWDLLSIPPGSQDEGQIGWLRNPLNANTAKGRHTGEGSSRRHRVRVSGPDGPRVKDGSRTRAEHVAAQDDWTYRPIADKSNFIPGIHRARIGNFYSPTEVGVIGVPIFDFGAHGVSFDQTPCSYHYYPVPVDAATRSEPWDGYLVSAELHICHTVRTYRNETSHTDFIIQSSLEGASRVTFPASHAPEYEPASIEILNKGMEPVSWSPFYGAQSTAVGMVDGVPSYMAEVSPWEGVDVQSAAPISILTASTAGQSVFEAPLLRWEVDVLGPQAHDVATGDFNGDGCDDFVVAQRGPVTGVWLYQCEAKDLSAWRYFPVTLDADYGASQLFVHDFDGDGRLDIAATGFSGFDGAGGGNHYVAVYYHT